MPGAYGDGNTIVTVWASSARTCMGLPSMSRLEAISLFTRGSYRAWKLKTTSADVNGVPSENTTSSRSMKVQVRPSGDPVHSRASLGSSRPVVRSSLTRVAWMSLAIRSSADPASHVTVERPRFRSVSGDDLPAISWVLRAVLGPRPAGRDQK